MARIDTLGNFLTDVADAIRTAEGSSETIQASDFDTRIEALSGGGGNKIAPTTLTFQNSTASSIDLSCVDVQNLTTFNVRNASNLTSLDLSNMEFDSLASGNYMFQNCSLLATLTTIGAKFPSLTSMQYMFNGCSSITSLDLSGITGDVTNWYGIFTNCRNLMFLDVSGLDLTKITTYSGSPFSSVEFNCEIIVKDSASKQWMNTNFSGYTNVKTKAEYEAE